MARRRGAGLNDDPVRVGPIFHIVHNDGKRILNMNDMAAAKSRPLGRARCSGASRFDGGERQPMTMGKL